MSKETFYFQHDFNPTADPKIVCLLGNYGGLGYGVYWRIVELLHQEEAHKLPLKKYIYEAIAKQMLANAEQIEAIINDCINAYELFISDGTFFWSNRVLANIQKRLEISEIRSKAGRAGAFAKQNVAKERKVKERKVNNNTPIGVEQSSDQEKPKQYGNFEINESIKCLEESLQAKLDGTIEGNRRYCKLLLDKLHKEYPDKNPVEQVKALIQFGRRDSFHAKNITGFEYLYRNKQKIVESIKNNQQGLIVPKAVRIS